MIPLDYIRPTESETQKRTSTFLALMRTRRTVRTFSNNPLPDGVVEDLVRTAATAPSGANKQPWHFVIVRDAGVKKRIRTGAEEEEARNYAGRFSEEMLGDIAHLPVDAHKPYLEEAPALIVVFKESYRVDGDGVRSKNYYVNESVGLAAGILIAAIHQAGLVTVTHTPSPMKFLNDILLRPLNETPILLMPIGYPAENTTVPDLPRKSFDEICTVF
jgi:iodotyrosine deiodinase